MTKLDTKTIFSIIFLSLSILGIVFLTTTAMISNYEDSNNFYRIFFNGRWKLKFQVGSIITTLDGDQDDFNNPSFPLSFTILALIGMITIVIGSAYWFIHSISGKKNCSLTKYKMPGPVDGITMGIGGLVGFIGSMVFLDFGNEIIEGSNNTYAFGYIVTTIIFLIFLLVGLSILILSKKKPKSVKKNRSKKKKK
ncbi:MAG: hypothetical protein JXA54_16670 [Candidatus Heimdallarchaeota archaeon]|nr:hypothetical protein [Candidatus Heimdallarchaeota archaeon]